MIKLISNEFIKLGKFKLFLSFIIFIGVSIILYKLDYSKNSIYGFIPFIGIISSIYFSGIISNEIDMGTFRYYLTKPYKRWKIYVSKYLTILIFIILNSLLIIFMFYILYKDINKIYIIKYFKYMIPLILISSLIIFNSCIINNSLIALGINIFIIMFGILIVQILFGLNLKLFEYTFLPYLDFTIFDDLNNILNINMEFGVNLTINKGIIINIVYFLILFLSGCLIFSKRDIKG